MPQGSARRSRLDLQRAVRLFHLDERAADSPFVEKVWRTRSVPHPAFISVAVSHWEMVVTRQGGRAYLSVRGPETKATTALIPANAEFLGIQFSLGAFMPDLPIGQLVDGALHLPGAVGKTFWLNNSAWEFPGFDNADSFVKRLVREGLVVRDPVVVAALQDRPTDLSRRTVERRVRRATGLTRGAIRQIERAGKAAELLDGGATILDAVERLGFADQAHLTRSLKRFLGQTPAEIVAEAG